MKCILTTNFVFQRHRGENDDDEGDAIVTIIIRQGELYSTYKIMNTLTGNYAPFRHYTCRIQKCAICLKHLVQNFKFGYRSEF